MHALDVLLLDEAQEPSFLHPPNTMLKLIDTVNHPELKLMRLDEHVGVTLDKVMHLVIIGLDLRCCPVGRATTRRANTIRFILVVLKKQGGIFL